MSIELGWAVAALQRSAMEITHQVKQFRQFPPTEEVASAARSYPRGSRAQLAPTQEVASAARSYPRGSRAQLAPTQEDRERSSLLPKRIASAARSYPRGSRAQLAPTQEDRERSSLLPLRFLQASKGCEMAVCGGDVAAESTGRNGLTHASIRDLL